MKIQEEKFEDIYKIQGEVDPEKEGTLLMKFSKSEGNEEVARKMLKENIDYEGITPDLDIGVVIM